MSARTPVDALREALDAGPTPGPWHYSPWHIEEGADAVRKDGHGIICTTAGSTDSQFIAACREGVPALLNAYDADRALIASLKESLQEMLDAQIEDPEFAENAEWDRWEKANEDARLVLSRVEKEEA